MEKLSTYRAKRNPKKTPEPMGSGIGNRAPQNAFVIQEHHARALHWDLRLERDGVLASWALPKGLPQSPKSNHLAIHTEDHPLDYLDFEGTIPEGEYGGGQVSIWDHGTYELEKWTDREVMVVLHGKRSEGRYVLFAVKDRNWMIHRMDPPPADYEPVPERIAPMLALTGKLPNDDAGWAYEFKWDGVRAIVYVEGGRVRAMSRNQKELTTYFPELRAIGKLLGSRAAVLDGEIVAFDSEGRPNFSLLAKRLHLSSTATIARRAKDTPASFLAFDLLYLDGHVHLNHSYFERRELLESLDLNGIGFATPPSARQANGRDVLEISLQRGLEGIVAKRQESPYSPGGRSGAWVKVKNFLTREVVIGGWTQGRGARESSIGALLLGIPRKDGLGYVGKVGTGFDDAALGDLRRTLRPSETETSPFDRALPAPDRANAHFVRPEHVGEVQFSEWTKEGRLRHPSWRGLRPDKSPEEVVRES